MRIAVLADIHGNDLALAAVLADLEARGGADLTVDLGDCVSGPLWPRETFERLQHLGALTVRGNHDRQVATLPFDELGPSDRFARGKLEPGQLEQLKGLPRSLEVLPGILAFHGCPEDDESYLLDEVEQGRLVHGDRQAIARRLGGVPAAIALCAQPSAGCLAAPERCSGHQSR